MTKKIKIVIASITILLVFCIGGAFFMYSDGQKAVSSISEDVVVEVSGGTSSVINQLDDAGLLKNKLVASLYLKLNDYQFKANTYVLNKNMDLKTICTILDSGDFDYLLKTKFTVLEGTSIPDYASVIGTALQISSDKVLDTWCDSAYLETLVKEYWFLDASILEDGLMFPLEGYLAPDTYFITEKEPTIESVTKMMLLQMDTNLKEYKEDIENFKINEQNISLHDFLTFSSIVECESLFVEDHAKIAGVFVHRLETGMKLQSDVTVNYAHQINKVAVTYNDLEVDSKYNTYRYEGLPVGPISSVSKEMLESCLNYEQSDYLFFFAIKGGTVMYTKTYEEHLAGIVKAKAEGLWLED